jgi:c-di-GMP-binding flagellar brake protein YcgR
MAGIICTEHDMNQKKDVPLKIELFSGGEDSKFSIHSRREILSILKGISQENTRAALYFDDGNDFILTSILKVNEQGLWLDVGSIAASNQHILRSNKIIFISARHQVKVQFVTNRIEHALLDNRAVFYLSLPDTLLRIQRREYFRLTTPALNPLICIIPVSHSSQTDESDLPFFSSEVTIMDISGGGVALVCEAHDTELHPGKIYADCKIPLPGVGSISATVKVKNAFEVTLRNGRTSKRAGCEFIQLSGEAATLLQRYVGYLQSEAVKAQQSE